MNINRSHINSRILRGLRGFVMLLATFGASAAPLMAASPKWEQTKTEHPEAKTVARDNDLEIRTARGLIVVTSSRPVQIKVYTILGQLVSQENLPAGTSRLIMQAHGVYIIKSADLTCKVAL